MISRTASAKKIKPKEKWDLVLRPQRSWWGLRLDELWCFLDLIGLFVLYDFVTYYKQTIPGPPWYIIQPDLLGNFGLGISGV